MRNMAWLALILCAGCGDSSSGQDLSVTEDMTAVPDLSVVDLRVASDMAMAPICAPTIDRGDAGASMYFMCGGNSCAADEYCCVGSGSGCAKCCTGFAVQCQEPLHCGGFPCCLTVTNIVSMPTPRDVTCETTATGCPPELQFATGTLKTRLCKVDADCTRGAPATPLNQCCTGMMGGQSQRFCLNSALAMMGGVTCP